MKSEWQNDRESEFRTARTIQYTAWTPFSPGTRPSFPQSGTFEQHLQPPRQSVSEVTAGLDVRELFYTYLRRAPIVKMPLPRRKLKRKQKKSTAGDGSSSQNFTVQQLLDAADRFGEEAVPDYNLIEQLLSKAVELDPQSSAALDRCGEFHCQHGDPDTALQLLKRSAEIAPESNWQTYLYLAQLSAGREAFALYEKGAELLLKGRVGGGASGDGGAASSSSGTTPASNAATNAVAPRVVATVASIYVAVCELFMTDLCDEPDAQTQCERNLQRAYDLCGDEGIGSVEVLTGLAVYNKVTMELDKVLVDFHHRGLTICCSSCCQHESLLSCIKVHFARKKSCFCSRWWERFSSTIKIVVRDFGLHFSEICSPTAHLRFVKRNSFSLPGFGIRSESRKAARVDRRQQQRRQTRPIGRLSRQQPSSNDPRPPRRYGCRFDRNQFRRYHRRGGRPRRYYRHHFRSTSKTGHLYD